MNKQPDRRQILKGAAATCAALLLPARTEATEQALRIAGQRVEIQITPVSKYTARLTILPLTNTLEGVQAMPVGGDGSLVQTSWGAPILKLRTSSAVRTVKTGNLIVKLSCDPVAFSIETLRGATVQHLTVDKDTGAVSFISGDSPLLGLGQGGPQ